MPVIGLNFKSMNVKVKKDITGGKNVNVNSTPTIENIGEKKLDVKGVSNVLSIDFTFNTKYDPDLGNITIKGEVLYQSDDKKKVMDQWKKSKVMTDTMAVEVLNNIFRRCLTKAIDLAYSVGLPPPIRFPIVKAKDQKDYID